MSRLTRDGTAEPSRDTNGQARTRAGKCSFSLFRPRAGLATRYMWDNLHIHNIHIITVFVPYVSSGCTYYTAQYPVVAHCTISSADIKTRCWHFPTGNISASKRCCCNSASWGPARLDQNPQNRSHRAAIAHLNVGEFAP